MEHAGRTAHGRPRLEPDEPRADIAPPTPAEALLALQRSAGNRAVGAMLARDAASAEPQDAAPREAPASGPRVIFPGVGTIPIESFQSGRTRARERDRDGNEAPKKDGELPGGEMYFTSRHGAHSARLFRESLSGSAKDVEVILSSGKGGQRMLLKGALISSYSVSAGGSGEPMESWALDFESATHSVDPEAGE